MACPVPATGASFIGAVLANIDCQARNLGSAGYAALADAASPVSLALTALITIFVALFGVRMILGRTPDIREGVMAAVKIGIVLMLATSWPAYRTLVYDVVIDGPAQLAGTIGGAAAIPGSDGSLVARLQAADDGIAQLVSLGTGRSDMVSRPAPGPNGEIAPIQRETVSDDLAFGFGRVLFLAGAIGAFGLVRLAAGVLLALAPLFAGLLLFDATRGMFAGWLRALAGLLLAGVAATIVLGVALAVVEPWLADVLSQRMSRIITPQAPVELLVLALGFDIALFGGVLVIARLAFALHIPTPWRETAARPAVIEAERRASFAQPQARASGTSYADTTAPSRALAVADALAVSQRRSAAMAMAGAGTAGQPGQSGAAGMAAPGYGVTPLGQSFRRTRNRPSQSAARRDRRA